jgi:phospholipid-transporting ATPase
MSHDLVLDVNLMGSVCQVVLFSFFKNFLYPLPLFWYSCYSQFSGQSIYDSLIITNFNMFFSSLPPLIAGVLEKDVIEQALLKHPIAYKKFRESPTFTLSIFLSWMALGTYQSIG